MTTQYHVCGSTFAWHDPQALNCAYPVTRHRLLKAAVRSYERMQAQCRRTNGPNTRRDVEILATVDRGDTYRKLNDSEIAEQYGFEQDLYSGH